MFFFIKRFSYIYKGRNLFFLARQVKIIRSRILICTNRRRCSNLKRLVSQQYLNRIIVVQLGSVVLFHCFCLVLLSSRQLKRDSKHAVRAASIRRIKRRSQRMPSDYCCWRSLTSLLPGSCVSNQLSAASYQSVFRLIQVYHLIKSFLGNAQ